MNAYKRMKKEHIRVDKVTQKISVMDTTRTVLDCDSGVAVSKLNRHVFAKDDERVASIRSRMTRIKINGYGNKTPVTDLNTLAEVIWFLPGGKSTAFRLKSAEKIGRALGGDLTLFREKLMMPRPEEPATRQSIVEKALRSVDIAGGVRIDTATGKASMLGVIRLVVSCISCQASTRLTRLFAQDDSVPSIESRTTYIRINGRGKSTPVADLKTIVEMIWKLPGKASARFRHKSAETMCRVMGGDPALLREIEQNNLTWGSVDGGDVIQQALLKPVEYKEVEEPRRVKECSVRDALAYLVGGEPEVETPAGFIDVLSDTDVIEVKYYRQWKHGLGQVLAYHSFYPRLAKRLHLFAHVGDVDTLEYFSLAESVCSVHEVKVTFEEVPAVDDDVNEH